MHSLFDMSGVIFGQDGYRYIESNEFGYQVGKRWDDGAGGHVSHISIFYGDVVYSIQATYLREGTAVMSQRHGGNLGSFEMIDFTDDPLTWVSGYSSTICLDPKCPGDEETSPWNYEKVITSLEFGTAKSTYGPFGKESGVPFSFKSTTGNCGFHGWSTDKRFGYLRAIGVYIRCPAMCFLGEPSPESESGTSSISSLSLN